LEKRRLELDRIEGLWRLRWRRREHQKAVSFGPPPSRAASMANSFGMIDYETLGWIIVVLLVIAWLSFRKID
jgi:hypothetical protein